MLLVDDDHNDRSIFALAADRTDLDLWVQTAADAQQAMDYLQGHGSYADRTLHPIPHLLLLDLKLPGMDGLEFLGWLRADRKYAGVRVVVFSGSEDAHPRERALELGAERVLVKPFRFEDWIAMVRQIWEIGIKTRSAEVPGRR